MEGPTGPTGATSAPEPYVEIVAAVPDGADLVHVRAVVDGIEVSGYVDRATLLGKNANGRRKWLAREMRKLKTEPPPDPLAGLLGREDV